MSEPQGRISGNGALTVQYLRDSVCRYPEVARELRRADANFPKFLHKVLAGMNSNDCHKSLLMIVDDLNIRWTGRAIQPFKTDAPLIVDANAVLALAVTFQAFKPVAG